MPPRRAGRSALGLDEHIGTVEEGKLADLLIVDGDALSEPEILSDPSRIWLVLQLGTPVAGQALEQSAYRRAMILSLRVANSSWLRAPDLCSSASRSNSETYVPTSVSSGAAR